MKRYGRTIIFSSPSNTINLDYIESLSKLDEYGQPIAGSKGHREERHKLEVFQEFYIEDKIAVKDLLHLFAINAKTFDFEAFMSEKEEELPVAGV